MENPILIQGGMGAAVSNWRLARAVSLAGQLGVVSGTALDTVLVRRLQDGDPGGHMRRAIADFPEPDVGRRVLERYFIEGGKQDNEPYAGVPMFTQQPSIAHLELTVLANFVEVYLAKDGHNGSVGINYLEKIQLPTLPSLYGAMLAGVDFILMGAGIPRAIPGILDKLAKHEPVSLRLNVDGAGAEDNFETHFEPRTIITAPLPLLKRPKFLAIVSSLVLALTMARKSTGKVDGFVLEHYCAGGHNAPPRGALTLNQAGEPIYSSKDEIDLDEIRKLQLPFWLAGAYGYPEKLKDAIRLGAQGIQVGTIFALSKESGLSDEIKSAVIQSIRNGTAAVFTDPLASPTGFPFKVVLLQDTLSDSHIYDQRTRICDLGYLRTAYKTADGSVGFRCASEPADVYLRKGGCIEDTTGRKCLCNALLANIGHPQLRSNEHLEEPLVTAGQDLGQIARFIDGRSNEYCASEVIEYLLDQ